MPHPEPNAWTASRLRAALWGLPQIIGDTSHARDYPLKRFVCCGHVVAESYDAARPPREKKRGEAFSKSCGHPIALLGPAPFSSVSVDEMPCRIRRKCPKCGHVNFWRPGSPSRAQYDLGEHVAVRTDIEAALRALTLEQFAVVWWHYYLGYSQEAVAAALSVARETVKYTIRLGRRRMLKKLSGGVPPVGWGRCPLYFYESERNAA